MTLFVGFAPFFILCLMFKKTTPYFSKWLNYGLATMFSSALLAAMASISTDLVEIIARAQFKSKMLGATLEIITGSHSNGDVSGVFQSAMNQLGLGLMLSTVLVVVPPMAGNWFNGVMGGYFAANYMDRWNNPNGQNTVGTGQGSGAHGIPAYGNQQQSVNYQNDTSQPSPLLQATGHRYMHNSNQPSAPITPSGLAVGVGKQTQQSEPTNQNNRRNSNDSA